jgi:hypothetical protein
MLNNKERSVFLKYCSSIRDKYFHATTNDTSVAHRDLSDPRIKDKI